MTLNIKIKRLSENAVIPRYARPGDAGMDLVATEEVRLPASGKPVLVPTGLAIELPEGYAALVIPRSGLAAKEAITVVNSPGLIDSGYRGEIKVILQRTYSEGFDHRIDPGTRIAQLLILPHPVISFVESDELGDSDRGERGFGSTGVEVSSR